MSAATGNVPSRPRRRLKGPPENVTNRTRGQAMAHIDSLIDKVADPSLRQMLREQVDGMLNKKSFGLVFQAHKPETVELPN